VKIIDADILAYALLENHVATPYARSLIERGLKGELKLFTTAVTLLETYNTLIWHYRVRPRKNVARKVWVVAKGLILVPPSPRGFEICAEENVPLGDAILLATAIDNGIPIVVSNDRHVKKLCAKYGLVYENPIPEEVRHRIR
jgi:predicted nucleic acid-binding protein